MGSGERPPWLVDGHHLAVCCYGGKGDRRSKRPGVCYKGTKFIIRDPILMTSSNLNHIPKTHLNM